MDLVLHHPRHRLREAGRRSLKISEALGPFEAPRIDAAQRRFWLIVDAMLAALVVVALVGGWAYVEVRGSLRDLRTAGLLSLLEAEARGLQLWIAENGIDAARLVSDPEARLAASRLLRITAPGTSRDVYAFDASGRMLSESRYGGGEARDPDGGELTALAAAALSRAAGDQGVLLSPYRNHRGTEVIGAWRWLPEARMGVAVEIDAGEAYGPLEYLQIGFFTLFVLVLLSMTAAASASLWAVRLRMREAKRIGPYRIEAELGEGGMSHVYAATHTLLGRRAAVKVLKRHLATDEVVERFHREAQLCSRLTHPNTVEIYDYGTTSDGRRYYAMEYLEGVSLERLVREAGPLPVARVVHFLRQACASLKEAHERGWVHRDVKPGNLMLCVRAGERDVVKLLDFGLVKNVRDPHTRDLTQYSKVLGTPLYMAPERLRNPADADARADIYALGAVAYFALAGRPAFEAETDHDITYRVLNEPAPTLAQAGVTVPPRLESLIARCLAKDRGERPATIDEVACELDRIAAEV